MATKASQRRKELLCAEVCRYIVKDLINEHGPISLSRIYIRIKRVFRVNSAFLAVTLTKRDSGFIIDNGIVDHVTLLKRRNGKQ